ncbi:PAS domain-containing sensor histidine kinase [Pedobacter sp. SYSU D00535]|uniref:sensor histidine kinase n=1 Tax=Pedobacter sp. SYSU D00535 TaxID=2810308 RepID=UPI001A97B178|nr:ATP-binding protein [Pedobacter sp. SYSU D00535]
MKLKTKFILFSIVLHALLIAVVWMIYSHSRDLFLIGEALLLISLLCSIWMYRAISKPFGIISAGIESLKDRDFSSKLKLVGHQEMDELISVYNMMMDRLREERLQQLEKHSFLEKLIEASPTGILILDFDSKVSSLNPAAVQLMGIDLLDVRGRKLEDIPGALMKELALLDTHVAKIITLNGMQSFKCQRSSFIDRGFARTFYTIEELSKEIYAREKAAYERVVKMMSHEVNNSIGAINSILNSCLNYQEQLDKDDRDDYQNALQISIDRNKNLSSLMSNFARVIKIPEPVRQQVDLLRLLKSAATLMEPEASKKELEWQWETQLDQVLRLADGQQLEQVFINILKNAIEASPIKGLIRISAAEDSVSVSNTGPGIPPEISSQLFSPFFSTKKNGQGIGLMLTREILTNHGYRFSLESKNRWTEFRIDLI